MNRFGIICARSLTSMVIARLTFVIFKKSWFPESLLTWDTDGTIPFVALKCSYSDPLQSAKKVYMCTGTLLTPGPRRLLVPKLWEEK